DVKRIRRADGTEFLMRTQGEVLTNADGDVMRMLGVCEDVTDRVRADEAQALLASIVTSSNDAIFTATRTGRITTWNPAAERLFGWTADEATGQPAKAVVPAVDPAEDARLLATRFDALPADAWETVRRRKDGTTVPVSDVVLDGQRIRVTTSLGAALIGAHAAVGGTLLAQADAAMYDAKDAGRDRFVVHDADGAAPARRGTNWQQRIEDALTHDGFELHL